MDGWHLAKRVGFFGPRAFCCLLLLLPYAVPEKGVAQRGTVGMDAPPPPVLESHPRSSLFGGLERRLLSGWPVTGGLWMVPGTWQPFVLPQPVGPPVKRVTLAEFQQWRLEGG